MKGSKELMWEREEGRWQLALQMHETIQYAYQLLEADFDAEDIRWPLHSAAGFSMTVQQPEAPCLS